MQLSFPRRWGTIGKRIHYEIDDNIADKSSALMNKYKDLMIFINYKYHDDNPTGLLLNSTLQQKVKLLNTHATV